jgi:hypothetical protein
MNGQSFKVIYDGRIGLGLISSASHAGDLLVALGKNSAARRQARDYHLQAGQIRLCGFGGGRRHKDPDSASVAIPQQTQLPNEVVTGSANE